MDVLVGDKSILALEYVSPDDLFFSEEARLFLYVNGIQYGSKTDTYKYFSAIPTVLQFFVKPTEDLGFLFSLPGELVVDALLAYIYYDTSDDSQYIEFTHPIQNDLPNFLHIADKLDGCVFRFIPYAFDECTILVIPSKEQVKICGINDNDNYGEVMTSYEDFYDLWQQLGSVLNTKVRA